MPETYWPTLYAAEPVEPLRGRSGRAVPRFVRWPGCCDDLELATLSWVHWFNETRLHSRLGHVPPIEYENAYYRDNAALTEDNAALTRVH